MKRRLRDRWTVQRLHSPRPEGCAHVFIYADVDSRSKRILERYGESDKLILKRIEDKDARRKIYYGHYTGRPWCVPQNYHVSLSSSALGEDACVNTIVNLFQECD